MRKIILPGRPSGGLVDQFGDAFTSAPPQVAAATPPVEVLPAEPAVSDEDAGNVIHLSEHAAAIAAFEASARPAYPDGNISETARAVGRARSTIRDWIKQHRDEPIPPELLAIARSELRDNFREIALRATGLLAEGDVLEKIADGKNPDKLIIIAGVSVDKSELLSGNATARVEGTLASIVASAKWTENAS